jgi:hypothetical protein
MVETALAHNQREWEKLEGHLEYLTDHFANDAVRLALNEVARKCKTNLVRAIAAEPLHQSLTGQFASQRLPKLPPMRARQKDVRNLIYVRGAKKKHFKEGETQKATMLGYANDIPAIRLVTTKVRGGGGATRAKGGISHTATRSSKTGRKLKKPTVGGIKLGGTVLPDAFINVARYNEQVHIMRRTTEKTWKKGRTGWAYSKRKEKAPRQDRMPIGVVRYDIKTPMSKKMAPVVARTVDQEAQKSYDRAMNILINKSANKNF